MMTYKCPRHLKSRLPPPIQPVPGMSMEEKLFLEYERRQSIPPKIRHYDDGPRHGIECPFTMHVEWLGPHGPICVGVGKGKAASHADNCEPILNKNNFVSKVKHLTQAVPGHGLSAWKMYEFTPTAAPTGNRHHTRCCNDYAHSGWKAYLKKVACLDWINMAPCFLSRNCISLVV